MKSPIYIFLFICLFGTGLLVTAQSGGGKANPGGKVNKRPDPTPTPVETTAGNDPAIPDDGEVISVNTQVVSVPVRVLDKKAALSRVLPRKTLRLSKTAWNRKSRCFRTNVNRSRSL